MEQWTLSDIDGENINGDNVWPMQCTCQDFKILISSGQFALKTSCLCSQVYVNKKAQAEPF